MLWISAVSLGKKQHHCDLIINILATYYGGRLNADRFCYVRREWHLTGRRRFAKDSGVRVAKPINGFEWAANICRFAEIHLLMSYQVQKATYCRQCLPPYVRDIRWQLQFAENTA